MTVPGNRQQWLIVAVLSLLMVATRSNHSISWLVLPNASWAIFLIVGFYLRHPGWILIFLTQAFGLDLVAVTWGGVDNFCVSPAYPFLLPAYLSLWFAGRWYSQGYVPAWNNLSMLAVTTITATLVCELISSGGFYFFSGRFEQTTLLGFAERVVTYFPSSLGHVIFYVVITALFHTVLTMLQKKANSNQVVR